MMIKDISQLYLQNWFIQYQKLAVEVWSLRRKWKLKIMLSLLEQLMFVGSNLLLGLLNIELSFYQQPAR